MALNINAAKNKKAKPAGNKAKGKAEAVELDGDGKVKITAAAREAKNESTSQSFLKRGDQAKAALLEQQKEREQAQEIRGKYRSFRLPVGRQSTITFLDGALGEDGLLDIPMVYIHSVYHAGLGANGERINLICTSDTEGNCPICQYDKKSLVGLFTVIEHVEYQSGDEVVKNPRRLFLPKAQTLRELQEAAETLQSLEIQANPDMSEEDKLKGLRGFQFKVRRTGKKTPVVGDEFELVNESRIPDAALKKVLDKVSSSEAIDYDKELNFFTNDELHSLGIVDGVAKGVEQNRYGNAGGQHMPNTHMGNDSIPTGGKAGQAPELPANFADNL